MMKYLIFCTVLSIFCACAPSNEPETPAAPLAVVDIVVNAMQFEAPDTIPSGWVTFRLINKSPMTHFGILEKLPEGKHLKDQQIEIAPVFQNIMDGINGKELHEPDAGTAPPDWFSQIVFTGGTGLTSPGKTSETTLLIEPGNYLLECYVKSNGLFHSYNPDPEVNGMVHEFYVTPEKTEQAEPKASVSIDISSTEGYKITGDLVPGKQTIAAHFTDQKVYPNFVGHDVHLVQLSSNVKEDSLLLWMDWVNPVGFETPAPATFLGGTQEMPAGNTAYFDFDLAAGSYAFIAEVPKADSVRLYYKFTVHGPQ